MLAAVHPHHALVYPVSPRIQLQTARRISQAAFYKATTLATKTTTTPATIATTAAVTVRRRSHSTYFAREHATCVRAGGVNACRPLRVGYMSSDFGNHPLAHLFVNALRWHAQSKAFCVHVYVPVSTWSLVVWLALWVGVHHHSYRAAGTVRRQMMVPHGGGKSRSVHLSRVMCHA